MQTIKENIAMSDGSSVHVARFEPEGEKHGVVHFLHGFGEHVGLYQTVAKLFTDGGLVCVIPEIRGFGVISQLQSKLKRGASPGYAYYLNDVAEIREKISGWYPSLPVSLYGYSLGANIAMNFQLKYPEVQYKNIVLESPWLRLFKPLPKVTSVYLKKMAKWFPNATLSTKIKLHLCTHDKEFLKVWKKDKIFHDRISYKTLIELLEAGEYPLENAHQLRLPNLLLVPGSDKILSAESMREFARLTPQELITVIEYPEKFHTMHHEIGKEKVLQDAMEYIRS